MLLAGIAGPLAVMYSEHVKAARLQLAHSYYNAGDYKDAIPRYQEFLALYPNAEEVPNVQEFLQTSYVKVGKTEAELEQLTQGQSKAAVLADLYWEKGAKAYNDKDYATALRYFEKILIEFPASSLAAQAAFYRGESFYSQERYEEAAAAYRNFLTQFPGDSQAPTAYFRLGVSMFNQNRYDEAASSFETLIKKFPDDPLAATASENLPTAYAKLGKSAESENAYVNMLNREKDPKKRAALLMQLADGKDKNGASAEAITYYMQVDPSVPEYAESLYNVGGIYSKSGQPDKEMETYQKLMGFNPKDNDYRIAALGRLAEMYISQGQAQKALSIYTDVAQNAKDQVALSNAKTRIDELQKVLGGQ
jgi:TolA-binding protein